jgi:hypothetical protein
MTALSKLPPLPKRGAPKLPPLPVRKPAVPVLNTPAAEIDAWIASGARGWAKFDVEPPGRATFRHALGRRVRDDGNSVAVWGMLNPSSAGADKNDPTVTRVVDFTRRMGKSIALVVNTSDYIATKSDDLVDTGAPISPVWAQYVAECSRRADIFICGWGSKGVDVPDRVTAFLRIVRANFTGPLHCIRMTTVSKQPEHPLMLPATLTPVVYLA